ncbi:Pollen-specific protein [Melia azedarach]|uniref:Pollen-specific protein n=1 Tax=Melia azedarach TaxID=155640 RepID=A0ACC1XWG3_MELAZ|nr:Pollen-specific protein [Melia azedarach]
MAKLLLFFALALLPAAVVVNAHGNPFHIRGRVYCDTCRCGFETRATTYISGATVRIECKDRNSLLLKYSIDGTTDSTGTYNILVEDDHQDQICYAKLLSSPLPDCRTADPGRERSQVILTRSNGAVSNLHYANALGFLKDQPLALCTQLLKQYLPQDEYVL